MHERGDRIELAPTGARALAWVGGELYDVAAGWMRFPLDGSPPERRYTEYGPSFDAAVVAPKGDLVALLESTGTKGLLLESSGRLVREVDRSFYHASAYRYPLALFTLPDGRSGLVHCPKEYNRLEIEDAWTGESPVPGAGCAAVEWGLVAVRCRPGCTWRPFALHSGL